MTARELLEAESRWHGVDAPALWTQNGQATDADWPPQPRGEYSLSLEVQEDGTMAVKNAPRGIGPAAGIGLRREPDLDMFGVGRERAPAPRDPGEPVF